MEIDFERLFSMATFEGLRTLRDYKRNHPHLGTQQLVQMILEVEPDASTFDLLASEELLGILEDEVPNEGEGFYRGCIEALLLRRDHAWAKIMTLGRARFTNKLKRDQQSIFRQAGLMTDPPDDYTVEWWARTTGRVRFQSDQKTLIRARDAERMSLAHEINRLRALGVEKAPVWTAIEDNTAGYDVLSYHPTEYGLENRLIEVKSSVASPLRFFVTRNEWEQAAKFGGAYLFHIWDMLKTPPILHIRKVEQVAPHIPTDNADGKWQSAAVLLSRSVCTRTVIT